MSRKPEVVPFFQHCIFQIRHVDPHLLVSCADTLPLVRRFIAETHLSMISRIHHDFTPHGNTILCILSTSHLAVHAWPEHGFIHLDLMSCEALPPVSRLREIVSGIFATHAVDIQVLSS
jgi:S-adenosylmethionine/arginine decarboxylase-like enzyme